MSLRPRTDAGQRQVPRADRRTTRPAARSSIQGVQTLVSCPEARLWLRPRRHRPQTVSGEVSSMGGRGSAVRSSRVARQSRSLPPGSNSRPFGPLAETAVPPMIGLRHLPPRGVAPFRRPPTAPDPHRPRHGAPHRGGVDNPLPRTLRRNARRLWPRPSARRRGHPPKEGPPRWPHPPTDASGTSRAGALWQAMSILMARIAHVRRPIRVPCRTNRQH